jgi:hypothetical protein
VDLVNLSRTHGLLLDGNDANLRLASAAPLATIFNSLALLTHSYLGLLSPVALIDLSVSQPAKSRCSSSTVRRRELRAPATSHETMPSNRFINVHPFPRLPLVQAHVPREMQAGAPCTPQNCPSNQSSQQRQPSAPPPGTSAGDLQGQISPRTAACLWLRVPCLFDCPRLLHPQSVPRVAASCKYPSILLLITAKHPTLPVVASGAKHTLKPARARGQFHIHLPVEPKVCAFAAAISFLSSRFHLHFRIKSPRTSRLHRLRRSRGSNF